MLDRHRLRIHLTLVESPAECAPYPVAAVSGYHVSIVAGAAAAAAAAAAGSLIVVAVVLTLPAYDAAAA